MLLFRLLSQPSFLAEYFFIKNDSKLIQAFKANAG